ncbi:MAG: hypothetical protein L0332_22990 [Chloroflexi bacterium]|nr:hypothetical protein [Chloroflexota bacterium]MCI0578219.1 hypothetical protein [Chloroflexota bacterium]MCI0645288.1 hypothetical protein [Chloroflexota bacterium]MCI0729558.1 hypothetical protein [Chloroflexota bacterium]
MDNATASNVTKDSTPVKRGASGLNATSLIRDTVWWVVFVAYLILFALTGFFTFVDRDANPALDQRLDALVAASSDATVKDLLIKALQDESSEHEKRSALAAQSFHIVLGALLGFLSASAAISLHETTGASTARRASENLVAETKPNP